MQGDFSKYVQDIEYYAKNSDAIPSEDFPFTWNYIGPGELNSHNKGIVVSLYIDPSDINKIYAGTNASGLFKTTDGGLNWTNVTDVIGIPASGVRDIAVDPGNTDVKYIAMGNFVNNYSNGIFKTSDDCQTWEQVLEFQPKERLESRGIAVDPYDHSYVFALVDGMVYRGKEFGTNWEIIFDDLEFDPDHWDKIKNLVDIEFKPDSPGTLFICSQGIVSTANPNHLMSAELWITHNSKEPLPENVIWQRIENGFPEYVTRFNIEPSSNPQMIYIGYSLGYTAYTGEFFLCTATYPNYDTTQVFSVATTNSYGDAFSGLGYHMLDMEIVPSYPYNIMCLGGYNLEILNLTNFGYSSYLVNASPQPDFHVDQRVLNTVSYQGTNYVYCGNDGGVSRYNLNTSEMESLNGTGLYNNEFFGIGKSERLPEFIIGGAQDNGIIGNGSGNFEPVVLGDGYRVIIDPIESNIVYVTANGGNKAIYKSYNFGLSYTSSHTGIPSSERGNGFGNGPLLMSPFNNNDLYIAYSEVWKTTNAAASWQQFTDFHNDYNVTNKVRSVAVTEANEEVMYVAYHDPVFQSEVQSKLFKTTDNGITWEDLTSVLNDPILGTPIKWTGISDIFISPFDENSVWISFNGFYVDQNGNSYYRVIESDDGFDSWIDISANLPSLPINDLDGIAINNEIKVLAANDLGLFLYDDQENQWENISNGIPPTVIRDIEVNYSGNISVATFGRGIWKTDIPCDLATENITISENKEWSQNRFISGTITVDPGVTLTIKNTVGFTNNAKIIVKPTASLILDGCKLTNACDDLWKGIEVWGNPESPYTIDQGKVILSHDAIIENAEVAIRNFKYSYDVIPSDSKQGGLITATNSFFINNNRAIDLRNYDYLSHIILHDCEFSFDDEFMGTGNPAAFIRMRNMTGIHIENCDFINESSNSQTGKGIKSFNSTFDVDGKCLSGEPCTVWDNSHFENLEYGIYATVSGSETFADIRHSDFYGNFKGLYISGMEGAWVTSNNFQIYSPSIYNGYGMYLDNCNGYKVEDNTFNYGGPIAPLGTGLVIHNSGTQYNLIYNNYFNNLEYGILAQEHNRDESGETGLVIKCNDHTDNWQDISVTAEHEDPDIGIRESQGTDGNDTKDPAGNTFSYYGAGNKYSDYLNETENYVTYWYHYDQNGFNIKPKYHSVPEVNPQTNSTSPTTYYKNESCPPDLEPGGGGSGGEDDGPEERMATAGQKSDSVQLLLDLLVDGGNTEALTTEVQTSYPPEAWDLYVSLLGKSPYLSDTVMTSAVNKEDVLPAEMVTDVLVANPQSAKSNDVLTEVENRTIPLTEEQKEAIMQNWYINGAKESLESKLSGYKADYTDALYDLICQIRYDTLNPNPADSIIDVLESEGSLWSKYMLASEYLAVNNVSQVENMLNNIPVLFSLSNNEQEEYQDYQDVFSVLAGLKQTGKSIGELDSTQKQTLY